MSFLENSEDEVESFEEKRQMIMTRHQEWRKNFLEEIAMDLPEDLRP